MSQTEIAKTEKSDGVNAQTSAKKNILHVISDKNSHRGSLKRTFLPQYKIPGNASTEYLNKS